MKGLWPLLISMAATGFFCSGIGIASFVLGVEITGPSYRGVTGVGQQIVWAVGVTSTALLAWAMQPNYGWRRFVILASLPGFVYYFFASFLLIESPR